MITKNFDIIIVGSGCVGGVFALQLAQLRPDFNIALLDFKAYSQFDYSLIDNRIFAISNNNYKNLVNLGIWPESRYGCIDNMNIHTDTDANLSLIADAEIVNLAKTVENSVLLDLIYQKLNQLNNVSILTDEILTIEYLHDKILINAKKSQYRSYLLVGADGATSFVRKQFQLRTSSYDYHRFGIVANFKCEKNHNNIAHQWFKDDKILAYLPCLNSNIISIVLSTNDVDNIINMSAVELEDYIANLADYTLGKIKLVSKVDSYPLKLNVVHSIFKKNLVLIGDAAHTIHPLAGLGINIGFCDAFKLAEDLAKILDKNQLGNTSLLHKYSLSRISSVIRMQMLCHGLFNFFAIKSSVFRAISNLGVKVINNNSYLKKIIVSGINKLI
jgi:2-octaprenylphenol hydroxylase